MTQGSIPSGVSHLSAAERAAHNVRPFRPAAPAVSADSSRPVKGTFVAKGHDAQLQDAQFNRIPVRIILMSGGIVRGIVIKRDKFTVTVRHDSEKSPGIPSTHELAGQEEIFYKHAIEGIALLRGN